MTDCAGLEDLWKHVYRLNSLYWPQNPFMPIVGNGRCARPKYMLVFINPTARNASARPEWTGPRYPFVGTREVWAVLGEAGMLDPALLREIQSTITWSSDLATRVLADLTGRGLYLTNLVKWTGPDGGLPDKKKIDIFTPILLKEIELVAPDYVIAFGLMSFGQLTGQRIKLCDYYAESLRKQRPKLFNLEVGMTKTKVIPCYFPVGRGDPKRAAEILRMATKL